VYVESSQLNQILISSASPVSLGTLSTIGTNKIVKTGGLDLLSNLTIGQAIKINREIKRVDYVEDDNTFYVTRDFKDTHTAGDTIYTDFSINNTNITASVGEVFSLDKDSFENQIAISELVGGLLSLNRCTVMTNATSLFIFDNETNVTEREESFITGTYNLDENEIDNLVNPFLAKIGRQLYFIIDMEEVVADLDSSGEATITGLNPNIYSIKVNGNAVDGSDYDLSGETISIVNSELLRGNFDYIEVLHFPNQSDYISDNNIVIKLGVYSFDKLFMLEDSDLLDLNYMCLRTDLTSQVSYEFYEVQNKSTKQKERIKTGVNSNLTITNRIGEGNENDKLIQKHLQYYIDNLDKFRIIRKTEGSGTYEYHNSAQLIDGVTFSEGMPNSYTYDIKFLQRVIISPNAWGDKKWGDFYWGVEKTALE